MARPSALDSMNIGQLQQLLDDRKNELTKLHKQKGDLQKKMEGIDRQIAKLDGITSGRGRGHGAASAAAGSGRRVRNEKSLNEMMEGAIRANGKPMSVGEIVDAVKSAGYHSNSANFRGIVNQTLIKDKRFNGTGERGVYQLKK